MDSVYTTRLAIADDTDINLITEQRHAMFTEMGTNLAYTASEDHAFRKWLRPVLQSGDYIGWFALHEGEIVGGAGLWLQDWLPGPSAPTESGRRAYLCNVFTNPNHRGKGIARMLVNLSMEETRARGLPALWLHASNAGQPIYESMGFTRTNEMRIGLSG